MQNDFETQAGGIVLKERNEIKPSEITLGYLVNEKKMLNPIIEPTEGSWDGEATYKPTVVWNQADGKWMLWYNGRTGSKEYIGHAFFDHRDLFPNEVK